MAVLDFDNGDTLFYQHNPAPPGQLTFAFFNALTGETAMWNAEIVPALADRGFGTLVFNYRGQKGSSVNASVKINAGQITQDCARLLNHLSIPNLVAVGLSIGGYFSLRAQLSGCSIGGHVLLNTLRKDGARLAWVNAATLRAVLTGGGALIRDLYGPLLFNQEWQAANRQNFLTDEPYQPLDPGHNDAKLMASGGTADWDIPWEQFDVPIEVVTGVQDRVFRDEAVINEILARLPNANATDLADCGHMVPVERPQAVVDACIRISERLL